MTYAICVSTGRCELAEFVTQKLLSVCMGAAAFCTSLLPLREPVLFQAPLKCAAGVHLLTDFTD